ncbi:MAG: YihY/virulence factor BrkB family protein [Actinomycetota bacterium]
MGRASVQRRIQRRGVRVWRWAYRFVRDVIDEWSKDRVGGLAAEIAFFALLGFFPAMIVLAAALGSADGILGVGAAADIESWLIEQITTVLGGDNNVEEVVRDLFANDNGSAFTVGAVLAAYAASRGFTAVVRALDVAYDHEHQRNWLSTRIVGFGLTLMTILVAATVLTLIVVGPLFGEGAELAERLGVDGWFTVLWTWFRWPVVFVALIGWAASLYHIAPNHRSPWKYELPGALLASVWWTAVSLGFGTYLGVASSGANAIFGLLGGALSLLFWLYLMAMGLLLGAEINSIIASRRGVILEAQPRQRLDRRLKRALRR